MAMMSPGETLRALQMPHTWRECLAEFSRMNVISANTYLLQN